MVNDSEVGRVSVVAPLASVDTGIVPFGELCTPAAASTGAADSLSALVAPTGKNPGIVSDVCDVFAGAENG